MAWENWCRLLNLAPSPAGFARGRVKRWKGMHGAEQGQSWMAFCNPQFSPPDQEMGVFASFFETAAVNVH